ncbi:MAG: hypothetical protein E7632_01875 [Ruminococcaceae bacterium]|nr:hypothetical protein [Oscillospiraceae bacterium]
MNRKNMISPTAMLILAAMLCSMAASCGDGAAEDTTAETTLPAETTASDRDADGYLLDDLPDDLDFGGETVTILGWNHYEEIEFFAEDQTGEIVNDAYYERNQRVEERLGVKLEFTEANCRWAEGDWNKAIQRSVMAGAGDYDITAGYSLNVVSGIYQEVFSNLLELEYLDFTKPWWSEKMVESASIAGSLYFTMGDISSSSISRMQGLFFNNSLLTDYKLENPYELVVDGKWTLDKCSR